MFRVKGCETTSCKYNKKFCMTIKILFLLGFLAGLRNLVLDVSVYYLADVNDRYLRVVMT